ncbi:topoisomerase II-associated protein PAT1-domain-containing protein [Pilobolus umbonatus]|nr:topoisomerase II-associated protein PAT1-domain-containing protein [Pilobolus umbonatus]
MGSFFGFNTNLPPLSEDELRALNDQDSSHKKEDQSYDYVDADIYDFATLRHELGADDDLEDNNTLGDHLVEEGDDNNNLTFSDTPVGQDFDFVGNTQRFSSAITEEEAFYVKKTMKEDQAKQNSFRNPWAATSVHTVTKAKPSSMASSKSIWGNFGTPLSPDNGFTPLSNNQSISPFSSANRQPTPFGSNASPTSSANYIQQQQQQQQQRMSQPVLLEDIEADLQRQAAARYRNEPSNGNVLSLAELEAALAGGNNHITPDHLSSAFNYQKDPIQLMAMKQQQELKEQQMSIAREMKRRELYRKSQYDGLMTQHDKDLVNRIQLSQLASGDPYADDFYYQVYSSLRQRAGLPSLQQQQNHQGETRGRGNRREELTMQRMQQQLQRIVNDARRRPKQSQVSLEGALGKITSLTVRNPRQVLQVPQQHVNSDKSADGSPTPTHASLHATVHSDTKTDDKKHTLRLCEDMYSIVLELEQMRRQGPLKSKRDDMDEKDEKEANDVFNEKHAAKVDKLWKILLTNSGAETPFLISFLSVSKGKKLVPRLVRQFDTDKKIRILYGICSKFSKLTVCRRNVIYPGTMVANVQEAKQQQFVQYEEVELFMNIVVPPLLTIIAESQLSVVSKLLETMLRSNEITEIAQSKPGLAFLTMLLSRAEILKQGGGTLQGLAPPEPAELEEWHNLYCVLFDRFKSRYNTFFPTLYYLVPMNPTTPMIQISLSVDDMYVWQFLAAMAVGASMEQQHILVTEVRDRVMENIVLAKNKRLPFDQANHRISNVNLFLHALGLDASQVSVPL